MKKKNKEEIIKYHQNKRKKHKIKLAVISGVLILISFVLIAIYSVFNKGHYINYKQKSNVDYTVNLIENEFYKENYVEEGIDVISNLIRSIDAEFKYNLELDKELEYTYNYKILAETEVKEKSKTNLIYETEQEIINKANLEGNTKKLEIVEKINIDYNEFNNQINKLIEVYKLYNISSDLNLNMYINIIDKTTGKAIISESKIMSLQMPLTTKTVEIAVNEKNDEGQILLQEGKMKNPEYILIIGVLILIAGTVTLFSLIKYILDTRSAEKMYDDELKKILFDYKSYIQKINNKMDYSEYKVINIDTFNELLGMREEVQSPIFMYSEENVRRTSFIMMSGNLLFEFVLASDLIREKLIKRSKEKESRKNEKNK